MYKMSHPQQAIRIFIPVLYAFVGVLLMGLIAIHYLKNMPFANLTMDPASTFDYNPFYGYISNIGILFWCATASVSFLSAGILNARKDQKMVVRFLVCFGALTTVLMFDDLFMFHESLGPWYLHVPEKATLAMYGLYASFCFVYFRKIILGNKLRYLILSIAAFGFSVLIDQASDVVNIRGEYFLEDGAKLVGIASWLAYFVDFSFNKIMTVLHQPAIRIIKSARHRNVRREGISFN